MKKKLYGIFREPVFSPNAVEADRAILEDTLRFIEEEFSDLVDVRRIDPANMDLIDFEKSVSKADYILSMAQGKDVLAILEKHENQAKTAGLPCKIWNPVYSIKACFRKKMSELLSQVDVGYPSYHMVDTSEEFDISKLDSNKSFWIKRGDFHAVTPEDVSFAKNTKDVLKRLEEFKDRGVEKAIIQEHAEGQVVKFYGVRNGFFDYRLMSTANFNDKLKIDLKRIRKVADEAAKIMKLEVYGGDCIITREGTLHVIDMNDWPSFRTCRKHASKAIAYHALNKLMGFDVRCPVEYTSAIIDSVEVTLNNIDTMAKSSGVIHD